MSDLRQPKGTLHAKRFGKGAAVTPTLHSKKHGHLWLISAIVLDADTVLAFYGRKQPRG